VKGVVFAMESRTDKQIPMDRQSDADFVQLLARHEPEIRGFIRASLPNSLHVTEVMQNVSLVAWKKFSDLENPETDFAKWACVIARYEILKYRRGLARDRFLLDEDIVTKLCIEGEEEISHRAGMLRHLERCLAKLPTDRRTFVLQAYAPGNSIKEMARQRGKRPDALYQLLRRIRQKLETCISHGMAATEVHA
jgi:RNA polymerase sigma-70 factor, ECF subfamily